MGENDSDYGNGQRGAYLLIAYNFMEIVLLTVNLVLLLVLLFLFIGRRQTKQWDELQTVLRQQMQKTVKS
jgi:preprotein translocase subunit YajC